jgi:hypothetical protein
MKKIYSFLLWILAVILSLGIGVFQRMTGPTYPVKSQEILGGTSVSYKLLRSYTSYSDMPVEIIVEDKNARAFLNFKRYKSDEPWNEIEMERKGATLSADIPGQPSAGKMEYSIRVKNNDQSYLLHKGKSLVVRFKNKVPSSFLILHIIFMFFTIIFSLRTAMETLRKKGNFSWMVSWTLGIVVIGGMVLGPIVQKYAFGDFWTGFPYGTDLTDNKVLFAIMFWILALFLKKMSKWWVFLAALFMLIIYMIPHSAMGSELDYKTGKMTNKYSYNLSTAPVLLKRLPSQPTYSPVC